MKSTDITKIYMGDTQGQKLFLGDDLIWPVGGPTPTGDTRLAVTYNVTSTTQTTKIIYTGTTDFSKAELEDGTEIPVAKTYTFPQTGLTKVYYTLSGTSIPEQAFYGLRTIVGVELPSSGLEEIGTSAFRNCGSITGVVTIPNNVTLGDSVFSGCTALTQVTIANDCNIGASAFTRCSGLTDLTIASGCNIGANAFNRCMGLADLTIGSGCDIGASSFTQCTGLTEVAISSDTTVGNGAFSQCTGLTGITLPNECEIGEGGFSRCSGLTQVTIPSDSNLGASAFSGCTGLTDVTVQSGVTLGYRAFYGISYLKRVTIGPGVSFVSGATFNSTGYEEVILEGTPPLEQPTEMVFRGGNSNPYPIYVADAQVDAWKNWFDLGPGTYSVEIARHVVPISERTLIPNTYKRLAYCGPYGRTMTYVEADYAKPGFDESMWAEYEFELRKIPTGTTEVHVFSGDNYRFAQIGTEGNWSVLRGGNSVSITTSPFPDAGSDDVYSARTYSFFKNGDNIEVDGVVVGSVTDPGTSPDSIHPRFYSAMGSDDYATYGADGFLYRAKVGNKDEGSSLIAHYVPVQRRSDDVYGLWDFVTSTFLPQDNGTVPPIDYTGEYFTIEALASGDFNIYGDPYYSVNNGEWTLATNATTLSLTTGDKVRFKALANYNVGNLLFRANTLPFKVYGNIESLEYGDDFSDKTTIKISGAFESMFGSATGLVDAENLVLPASTLAARCYSKMFHNCTNLTKAPSLPATQLQGGSEYYNMFADCTSLVTAPDLPVEVLYSHSYEGMFSGCTSLNYIKCLATNISGTYCTNNWVSGVAASGTFVKNANMTGWTTGVSGIPAGWTVVDNT